MEIDPVSFVKYLERGGLLALLAFIIITGMKQVWVWGWQYRQAVAEREEWKARWIKAAELAQQAIHK